MSVIGPRLARATALRVSGLQGGVQSLTCGYWPDSGSACLESYPVRPSRGSHVSVHDINEAVRAHRRAAHPEATVTEYDDEAREWFVGTANPVEVELLGANTKLGIITSWNEIGIVLTGQELRFIPWLRIVGITIPEPQEELARKEKGGGG